ncbi:MAG: fused signal recognition particle receptor, partial [Micromonosporaceae bacterium]|nr:fused signal recognition particle receptor [Micromonosporaceae bacterium]
MEMYLAIGLVLLVLLVAGVVALLTPRRRRPGGPATDRSAAAPTGPAVIEAPSAVEPSPALRPSPTPTVETPEPTAGRLIRLRSRLSRSESVFGRSLLALLARDKLDDDTWDEIEETLIGADVGVAATAEIVERLREQARVLGTSSAAELRKLVSTELINALEPELDRTLAATRTDGRPAVLLVVGVNGSGKTTTC